VIAVVQQLTIFDALPKKEAFAIGDTVEVVGAGYKGFAVPAIRGLVC